MKNLNFSGVMINLIFVLLLLSFVNGIPTSGAEDDSVFRPSPIVNTTYGPIQGKVSITTKTLKFLSIPFAQAPIEQLRWKAPQTIEPWTEVRLTQKLPKSCMQHKNTLAWGETSEDCLYLNVFCPGDAVQNNMSLPVLVWFYGGSWEQGGTSIPIYDGEFDAKLDDVVVVTVNYRLGVFGFLGSDALRANPEDSTGNYGMQDQVGALQWVHDNIAAFGGDAQRVTIFGQSAGSGSVAAHLVSPFSKGLFQRAIMQSGPFSDWGSRSLSDAELVFELALNATGCSTVDCLRSASAETLLGIHGPKDRVLEWSPVIDKTFLLEDPRKSAAMGDAAQVPVMLGTTKDEATTLIDLKKDATSEDYEVWLNKTFGVQLQSLVSNMYPAANYSSPWDAAVDCWSDWGMVCAARRSARWLAMQRNPVYLYQFTHSPVLTRVNKNLRSFHGAEIPFVFHLLFVPMTIGEESLASKMSKMWTHFAASGNPNENNNENWAQYSIAKDNNIVFDANAFTAQISQQTNLRKTQCDFWDLHERYHQ